MTGYRPITMTLLCMAAMMAAMMTVKCCVLKREKGLTGDRLEPVTIVGIMGNTIRLLGYLETPTQPFYKDHQLMNAGEHIYELTIASAGYQVNIRFLTCTDEGFYRIGKETFYLSTKANTCGMFYYTAKVDKVKKAAFVSPLDGVIRISMLYIHPENDQMWSVIEVWNDTMSRRLSPEHCCFMIHNGNTFGGYGDKQYHYFMYQRHGQVDNSCTNVQHAAYARATTVTTTKQPMVVIPDLKELENVETSVTQIDMSDSALYFIRFDNTVILVFTHVHPTHLLFLSLLSHMCRSTGLEEEDR